MNFDIEQAIAECEKTKRDDEVVAFAIGAGRMIPMSGARKQMREALNYIKQLEGFVGVNPVDLWHTMIIFDTLNNAKMGMNMMKSKGIQLGNIVPILIDKEYVGGEDAKNSKG